MSDIRSDATAADLQARGVFDLSSGLESARRTFREFRSSLVPIVKGEFSSTSMGLLTMVTRAQAFHDGALAAIEADNPWTAHALIRSYAENAAVLLWMLDKPDELGRLSMLAHESERFAIGRVVSSANKRAPGFKALYAHLSEYAHPVVSTFNEGWQADGESRVATWTSVPTFKVQDQRQWTCFWLVELTEVHANTWPGLYQASVRRSSPDAV